MTALLAVLAMAVAAPAQADSLGDAQQQAAKIAAQIAALQPQVDQAMADYDTALDAVGQAVTLTVAAQRMYDALQARAEAVAMQQDTHVVALYESGGTMPLYARALSTGDPSSLRQVRLVAGVVTQDALAVADAKRVAEAAKQRYLLADNATSASLTNADEVNQRLEAVQSLLDQQQALFDQASAKAQQLEALRRAAAELAAERAAAAGAGSLAASSASPAAIPPAYRALYIGAAATCPGLSWTVLAAIGQVETHHGQGGMVSSAGALGPMQFMPATFARYARDGDHDGRADIMDPADAIYTAAALLCADGAGQGGQQLYSAIWNYNHADWYVQLVLALAAKIS